MYIESQDELESFVERASKAKLLAIDTEFLREKTYYPKLCLMQLATEDEIAIVDPFAVDDIKVLKSLFENEQILKIFHAGHQDIEIIIYDIGCVPRPLFDTQVAATLLGQAQQIGYGALVHSLCGTKLKKADSFTDWSVRPLSESQIQYAADDVIYLPEMYEKMRDRLEEKGRLAWLDDELSPLMEESTYVVDERDRYRRLKHYTQLSRRQMAAAREMAAWREIEARKRNVPRKWVLTDEQIVEACKREPRKIDDLFMVRGVRERLTTRDARVVVELVKSALDSSPEAWPEIPVSGKSEQNVDVQVDLLTAIVRMCAKKNDIAVPTLASHQDLVNIARGHHDNCPVLKGWRREMIGNTLLEFLDGKLALTIRDNRVSVEHLEN
ncbi:MAG: ribonuclease D [Coriobacteriaceae bacterium]|nr:ribonuclease D [Coriobacteriaceae bacterium]